MKTFEELHTLLIYIGPFCGFLHPNVSNVVKWPRILVPILRWVYLVPLVTGSIYLGDNFINLIRNIKAQNPGLALHHFVSVFNFIVYGSRVLSILLHRKLIEACCRDFGHFIGQLRATSEQMKRVRRRCTVTKVCALAGIWISITNSSIFLISYVIRTHNPPLGTMLPAPASVLITYGFIVTYFYLFINGVFHWVLNTFMLIPTVQFQILGDSLTEIFSAIKLDPEHNIQVNKSFFGPEKRAERTFDGNDREGKLTCRQLRKIDEKLNSWVEQHCRVRECTRRVNRIFTIPVTLGYFGTIIMVMILMFAGRKTKDHHPISLSIYSLITMGFLFANCYFGDDLKRKGEEITTKSLEADWFLYPVTIQKKLLFILQVSSNRPCVVSAVFGLQPLTLTTFFAVVQSAYSMYTFALSILD